MTHTSAHCLDLNVATVTATGAVVDFCYDCDDFIDRIDGVIVGIDADECRHNQPTDPYEIWCCGNVIAVSPAESRCPACRSTFIVTEQGGTFIPAE